MGMQCMVYGMIETDNKKDEENIKILKEFNFEGHSPLSNTFSKPNNGYLSSVISFGASAKNLHNRWEEWLEQFEKLLGKLYAKSAYVHIDVELSGTISIEYVLDFETYGNEEIAIEKNLWFKSLEYINGDIKEETIQL